MAIDVVTMNEAARRLGKNPERISGWVDALGMETRWVGRARVISEAQFAALKAKVRESDHRRETSAVS